MAAAPIVTLSAGIPPSSPQFWLDAATQAVRTYCEWHIAPVIVQTVVLDGPGGKLLQLPTLHVQAIISILNDTVEVEEYEVSEMGLVRLPTGTWTRRLGGIVVEFSHGYALEDVADVAGVISKLASRAATAASNITRQNAGSMGVSYGTANGLPPGIDLLQTEKDQLRPYKAVIR